MAQAISRIPLFKSAAIRLCSEDTTVLTAGLGAGWARQFTHSLNQILQVTHFVAGMEPEVGEPVMNKTKLAPWKFPC